MVSSLPCPSLPQTLCPLPHSPARGMNYQRGRESWALKEEDRRKLEVCHHRCLRRMLNITIYQVKEEKISNREVRKNLNNCYTISQMIELRRARWLEKISHINDKRALRKLIVA
jgi:hypothetical protein